MEREGLLNSDLDPRLTKTNGAVRLRFLSIYGTGQMPVLANLEGMETQMYRDRLQGILQVW